MVYFLPIQFEGERGSSSDGYGITLPGRTIKRLEIGELFRVGDRLVSQERRRLRDWLSDDQNAHDLFKGFLENVTSEELTSWPFIRIRQLFYAW